MAAPSTLLALVTMLLAAAVPVGANPEVPFDGLDDVVLWVASDGSSGLTRAGEAQPEGTQVCSAIAPLASACLLQATTTFPFGGNWRVGITVPGYNQQPPAGAFVGSVLLNLTGSKTYSCGGSPWGCSVKDYPSSLELLCNIALVNVFGVLVGDVNCAQTLYPNGTPTGDLTVRFHAGAFDPRVPFYGFPTSNSLEAGIGNYGGFLTAT